MTTFQVPTLAQMTAEGKAPEVLFWVGCAGSFDDRAKKITKAMAKILHHTGISYAVLGTEEGCTGDPAKRAGNEFLFQMQAMMNIQVLNGYEVKHIVTTCPHCFNTLKNEYPELGGKYEAPRALLEKLDVSLKEMRRCKQNGLCCGAGGAQMFKEAEKGTAEINHVRADEAMETGAEIVVAGCPFCNTMLTDGVKNREKEDQVEVLDLAEMIALAEDLQYEYAIYASRIAHVVLRASATID